MTFTATPFLILLLVTYPLWLLCGARYWARLSVMLVASLVFYGHDEWRLLFLLLAYGVVNWAVAAWIPRSGRPRPVLVLGIAFNLIGLAVWKYTPLLAEAATRIGLPGLQSAGWLLPFGISFYSFTGIAYMVDVYRRTIPAETNFLRCLLHIAFFPHLMAGPILRASEFLTQLRPGLLPTRAEAPREAALLVARGYFRKMVLADSIGIAIDPFFAHVGQPATAGVWALPYLYLYAFQIYFDFAGYTDIARGLALLFGFRWPENFNLPYLAASPREFWRRWHMTLSRFLRDYVYIPLGGNRRGWWRTCVNVMVTMLLGGLWHGGSPTFLVWGGLHGIYLVAQRMCEERFPGGLAGSTRVLAVGFTFNLVCLTWSFFRLTAPSASLACLRQCFAFDADKLLVGGSDSLSLWMLLGVYGLVVFMMRSLLPACLENAPALAASSSAWGRGFAWGAAATGLALALLLAPAGEAAPFIYFQF